MDKEKIINIRTSKNYSVYKLSKISGVPKTTIHDIEKGKNDNPRIKTVKAIAKALEVDINEII